MSPPRQLLVTDDTGAVLDCVWSKQLLEERGLALIVRGERGPDELPPCPYTAAPPMCWRVTLYDPDRGGRVIASLECDGGARVRAAKQLLVALDVGLLP